MPAEPTPTTVASRGVLHLIPVGLGEAPINDWLPHEAQALAGQLNTYIAENAKTARAFLKLTPLTHPLQDITIHELTPRVDDATLQSWLTPLRSGGSIGLVSEAGCPAVADPGARQRAVHLDVMNAGNAEYGVDAMGFEESDEGFAGREFGTL